MGFTTETNEESQEIPEWEPKKLEKAAAKSDEKNVVCEPKSAIARNKADNH